MAAPSRTAQFTRLHKILKRAYAPVAPDPSRTVLEHLLFAGCLENAQFAAAEEAFAALVHTFFDLNEIRVSSVRELSEVMAGLPDPSAAANRVKRVLQSVFEATYSFDLEGLRKLNLGPAIERLEKTEGTTTFSVAYVVQVALGGHSIPIDAGTLGALRVVELVTDEDVAAGVVPGLERAIPKQAGIEFGSLLHQLGADFVAAPYAPSLHSLLLTIEPNAVGRLPSRRARRAGPEEAAGAVAPAAEAVAHAEVKPKRAPPRPEAKEAAKPAAAEPPKEPVKEPAHPQEPAKEPPKAAPRDLGVEAKKKPAAGKKKAEEALPQPKPASPSEPVPKKKDVPAEAQEPLAGKKRGEAPPKKPVVRKKAEPTKEGGGAEGGRHESPAEGLAKRKPR
jgi:endonuclease-3